MNNTQIAKQLGSAGGKKSVEKRFLGKTKEEISQNMRGIRMTALAKAVKMTPEHKAIFEKGLKGVIENLRKNSLKE